VRLRVIDRRVMGEKGHERTSLGPLSGQLKEVQAKGAPRRPGMGRAWGSLGELADRRSVLRSALERSDSARDV
jgi:hypothetical protein